MTSILENDQLFLNVAFVTKFLDAFQMMLQQFMFSAAVKRTYCAASLLITQNLQNGWAVGYNLKDTVFDAEYANVRVMPAVNPEAYNDHG